MKKKLAGLMAASIALGSLMIPAPNVSAAERLPFKDVTEKDWHYEYVEKMYEDEVMIGTSEDKFEPNGTVTRAMFITALGRFSGMRPSDFVEAPFSDVDKNSWYGDYLSWAHEEGIVEGYEDGTFKPNQAITREEMIAAISRYIEYLGMKTPRVATSLYEYSDEEMVSDWASSYLDTLRISGIIEGDENGNLNPQKNLSRAEMAALVYRIFEARAKAWQGYLPDRDESIKIYGAKYLYWSGTGLTGGLGTDLSNKEDLAYPALEAYMDVEAAKRVAGYDERELEPANVVGISANVLGIDLEKTPVVKICYSYEGYEPEESLTGSFHINNGIPQTFTMRVGEDEGWKTGTADISELVKGQEIKEYDFRHVVFNAFEEGYEGEGKFLIRYIAFFETEERADRFVSEELAVRYFEDYYVYSDLDYKEIDEKTREEYDKLLKDRINEIQNSESAVTPADIEAKGGTCYYVSSVSGDDNNDGLSPEKPWKSLSMLQTKKLGVEVSKAKAGDGVFFERGSVFYPEIYYQHSVACLGVANGVTYGAYGKGAKPMFTCAVNLNGGAGTWLETEYENVYVLSEIDPNENFCKEDGDIGNIVINDGERIAVRVRSTNDNDPFGEARRTLERGFLGNGRDVYYSGGTTCRNPGDALRNDLEYIHDFKEGKLYLRCNEGNPGEVFDKIMISRGGYSVIGGEKDLTLDNLAIMYSSSWGAAIGGENLRVTNCEVGYCGGSVGSIESGIEVYGDSNGTYFYNCYTHDVGDGPLSMQHGSEEPGKVVTMQNAVYENNVMVACGNGVEIFGNPGPVDENGDAQNKIKNIRVHGNIMAYIGYGITQHQGKDQLGNILCSSIYGEFVDCIYEDNIMMNCQGDVFGCYVATDKKSKGWQSRNNTYILEPELNSIFYHYETINYINHSMNKRLRVRLPYNERYLTYLASIGIDTDGKFYHYSDSNEFKNYTALASARNLVNKSVNDN